jgi:hypothetical protein
MWASREIFKCKCYLDGWIPFMVLNKKSCILWVILGYSYAVMCFWSGSNIFVQGFSSHSVSSADATETSLTALNLRHLFEKVLVVGTGISALRRSMFQFTLQMRLVMPMI